MFSLIFIFKHNWKLRKSYNGIYRTVFLIMYHFIISTNISTRFPNYNQWKIYWRENYNDGLRVRSFFLLIGVKGVCQLFAIFLTLRISWSSCFSHIQYFFVCNFLKVKYKIGNWRYFKAHAYCTLIIDHVTQALSNLALHTTSAFGVETESWNWIMTLNEYILLPISKMKFNYPEKI